MNPLPFLQQRLAALLDLSKQATHVGTFDPDAPHQLGIAIGSKQIDFRLPGASDMDMRRFMVERVDNKSKAVSAMDDVPLRKTYPLGLWPSRACMAGEAVMSADWAPRSRHGGRS